MRHNRSEYVSNTALRNTPRNPVTPRWQKQQSAITNRPVTPILIKAFSAACFLALAAIKLNLS